MSYQGYLAAKAELLEETRLSIERRNGRAVDWNKHSEGLTLSAIERGYTSPYMLADYVGAEFAGVPHGFPDYAILALSWNLINNAAVIGSGVLPISLADMLLRGLERVAPAERAEKMAAAIRSITHNPLTKAMRANWEEFKDTAVFPFVP